ncbi:MAG: cytochrome o ubiquinol oxidase subunit III [Simkaniaceae bacterium]|nr:cytochrome o ubiquinol oxidase subunit III [Simkaniaceae bacterium]
MSRQIEREEASKTILGFRIYLLTDFMMFATLFAAYAVLRKNTFGGMGAEELFDLPSATKESYLLLLCAFTAGCGGIFAERNNRACVILSFTLTFISGFIAYLFMKNDLGVLFAGGHTWKTNAFLSAYYTLIGTFIVHLLLALLWILFFLAPPLFRPLHHVDTRRFVCLAMFWQFLNIVWIFIFSFVYLTGVLV